MEKHAFNLLKGLSLQDGISITTLAHSFRNPLNAIRGAVTFIKEEYSTDNNLLDFASIIEDEIRRLEMLISRLLSSSFTIVRRHTNINDLIKGIETATSLQANSRSIETSFEYGEMQMVKIDPFQMEQAIRNIINNAIEAMPHGGRLTIRTGTESDNLFIEITDTGVGIRRQSFPPRGSPGNNGRGFGLHIARQILNLHGGKLTIIPRDVGGTAVKVIIPIKERGRDGREKNSANR